MGCLWPKCDKQFAVHTSYLSCVIFSPREENVMKYAGKSDPVDVMGHLRRDKDMFRAKH